MKTLNIALWQRMLLPAVISLGMLSAKSLANGTEMLGDPVGLDVAAGSDVIVAGVGLVTGQPDTITVNVPGAVSVQQVILYWEGQQSSAGGLGNTNSILVNGLNVTGDRIGGPTFFFQTGEGDFWTSTYRADITALNQVSAGTNMLVIDGLDFDQRNNGAGVLVIVDDGISTSDIQIKDGNDCAFINFGPPLNTTEPVTYSLSPSATDRVAQLDMMFGSVAIGRPSVITVKIDDVVVEEFIDALFDSDGEEWDSLSVQVTVPASAGSLSVQALSQDAGTGPFAGKLPASFTWVASGLSILEAECTGVIGDLIWNDVDQDGCQDAGEPGMAGVTVTLVDGCDNGSAIAVTTTDANGLYRFEGLCAGNYLVMIEPLAGYEETTPNAACDGGDAKDSDCVDGKICVTLPTDNTEDPTNDCGLVEIPVGGDEGCTPGYWKNHPASWGPTGYSPQDKLGDVFTIPAPFSSLADATLMDAFRFSGGPKLVDKAALLLKHAVAALLNAAHPDVDYEIATAQEVIDSVNAALATLDKGQIEDLKGDLDWYNNAGCPLGGPNGGDGGPPPPNHCGDGDRDCDNDVETEGHEDVGHDDDEGQDDDQGQDDDEDEDNDAGNGNGRNGKDKAKDKDDEDLDDPDTSVANGKDELKKIVDDARADALPVAGCGEAVAVPMAFLGITWCVVVAGRRSRFGR